MNQEHDPDPISDLELERYVAGEIPAAGKAAIDARLAADPGLARKVREMRSQDQAFAVRFPAETLVPLIEEAAKRPTSQQRPRREAEPRSNRQPRALFGWGGAAKPPFHWGRRQVWAFAVIALCALPVVFWNTPIAPGSERLKGKAAELRLYRNTPAGAERVANGAGAAAGDIFQVEFHPGNSAYGAIISVDGNGSVTLHWPAQPEHGTAWSRLPEHRLPAAFQLDDSPGFERFHLLLSQKPIDLKSWQQRAAESAGRDAAWLAAQAPESLTVITVVLEKRP